MPRNVRNFWLTLDVDGRASTVETGPVAKDGGFSLAVKMRDGGDVREIGNLDGFADADGRLTLQWCEGAKVRTLAETRR